MEVVVIPLVNVFTVGNAFGIKTLSVHFFAFKNRNALKEEIESRNGKVSGSVSSKTDYLISNEPSTSAKSVKAAKLGVPVITEEEFLEKFKTQEETL